ncbi:MAG: hypothetical protein AB8G23_03940 [Myxococcota bacterium]
MTDSAPPFFTRYGFSRTGDSETPLIIQPYPEIGEAGVLRATIIASAIDLVGGLLTREIAGVDALMTSDLSLRIPHPEMPARLLVQAERIRTGRKLVTTGTRIQTDLGESGAATDFAYGETTFVRVPRAPEDAPPLEALQTPAIIESHPLQQPLASEVGIQTRVDSPGRVELALRPALLNPEGIMQGALVALLIECAALDLAGRTQEPAAAARFAVSGLDLRFLSSASVGPVLGKASWIGQPEARMIRVELRDHGRENRLTASALVNVLALPES